MNPLKYPFVWLIYVWLRFDPVLWITFKHDWKPRYDFMAALFGQVDTTKFLDHRVKLVRERNRPLVPIILPSRVGRDVNHFFKADVTTKAGREKRLEIVKRLIFWCTDEAINEVNIESYRTRMSIIEALFNQMFQNSLKDEGDIIMASLKPMVFSRVSHTNVKGEPSPLVHDIILKAVGRLLISHFSELKRLSHVSLDKLTKVQIIRELQKAKKGGGGSLAYSAEVTKKDAYQHKFPLPADQVKLLVETLNHYSHSGWPDSREQAQELTRTISVDLGFDIN